MGKILQEQIFLSGEGDAYYERNRGDNSRREDWQGILSDVWERLPIQPTNMLEVGCGAGDNLAFLSEKYGVDAYGLEPSRKAVEEGNKLFPGLKLRVGAASALPYGDGEFDCLFFGFCLYMCDRTALFTIVREADRVLRCNGVMLILDFAPPIPYRNAYEHRPGMYSYKMRYRDMFLWNPSWSEAESRCFSHMGNTFHRDPDERVELNVLYKADPETSWLTNPFGRAGGTVEPP
jgi:ubiquinone/menaquinone biosynthesis C-methylase UbiE